MNQQGSITTTTQLQSITTTKQHHNIMVWVVWSVVALFYFYEICLRMLPGIMTQQTMSHFHIDATQLGMFTALYYWSYTLMQIPAGLMVDRFNIRNILCLACSICVIGFAIVHHTASLFIAEIGRFIIGLGSAFAYVSCLKVASLWLPKQRFGLASCILDSLGMLGALFTATCLIQVNQHASPQTTVNLLLALGVFITLLMALYLRHAKRFVKISIRQKKRDTLSIKQSLQTAIRSKKLWLLGLIGCLSYLPSSVIGDVWGLPYLQSAYHFDKTHASWILGAFFATWAIAGPFVGAYSDHFQSRKKPLLFGLLTMLSTLAIIIYYPIIMHQSLPFLIILILFAVMGIAASTHPLIFAMTKEEFSNQMAGTIVAITNMMIMVGGLVFQPLIGWMLDYHHSHARHFIAYSSYDFMRAFSIIPVCMLIAIIALLLIDKKKKPQQAAYTLTPPLISFGIHFR